MKQAFLISAIGVVLLLGCKKSSESQPPTQSKSQWTYDGKTYTATDAGYNENSNELIASDTNGNFVRVFFGSIGKPTASAHLVVLNYADPFTGPSQCSLQVGNMYNTTVQPLSTGKAGDTVFLIVSPSGKLSASFSNISVLDGTTTKTVSGALAE